jgi:hypothetical protein
MLVSSCRETRKNTVGATGRSPALRQTRHQTIQIIENASLMSHLPPNWGSSGDLPVAPTGFSEFRDRNELGFDVDDHLCHAVSILSVELECLRRPLQGKMMADKAEQIHPPALRQAESARVSMFHTAAQQAGQAFAARCGMPHAEPVVRWSVQTSSRHGCWIGFPWLLRHQNETTKYTKEISEIGFQGPGFGTGLTFGEALLSPDKSPGMVSFIFRVFRVFRGCSLLDYSW